MRLRTLHKSIIATSAVAAALGSLPAQAMGAHAKEPFDVVATIVECRGGSLTIAAQIEPKPGMEIPRAVRRANLRVRFEAAPLYGRSRRKRELDLGRTTSARRSERFSSLRAQSYSGIVRYRWVRGSRTVVSGLVRTRKARAAGRRGKAFCSIRVGRKPVDTQPPVIAPIPNDSGWHRGPLNVTFFVFDDLSGVALVVSRVDGGPFVRGRAVTISGEGTHTLEYAARDAAGNQTPVLSTTLRVDEGSPSTPSVTAPSGATSDSTPDISWTASSDSGSGVAGYVVLVRNSGSAIVWSQGVPASAPQTVTVGQTLDPGSYTAEVIAYDGSAPQPFTATGTRAFSVVAASPNEPPPPPPDSDGDGVADASDNCPSVANANQANFDGDGLGDACDSDDDNDGASDTAEASAGSNPKDTDTDNDGLSDGAEISGGTSPTSADTDADGFGDASDPCPTQPESGIDPTPEGCP